MEMIKELYQDYTFQVVVIGVALLGMISGVLGSFAVLRKQSLLGDGISHTALPGVILAFLIVGSKELEILLLGGIITGLIGTWCIFVIEKYSTITFDSALAMVLSIFFGLGLVLLTYVQKLSNANQAGLESFIYGQASAMLVEDVQVIASWGVILISLVVLLWKEFKGLAFDAEYMYSIGYHTEKLNLLLTLMLVIAIVIGLQTVGVILISAFLIAPAVAARQWVNQLEGMVVLSGVIGLISAIVGTVISASIKSMPTGPIIVVVATISAVISILLAHKIRGKRRCL